MKLYKTKQGPAVEGENEFYLLENENWDEFINDDSLLEKVKERIKSLPALPNNLPEDILAPVGNKPELWACGVTYLRSKIGRQEESKDAGGGDFYAKVYEAERPEIEELVSFVFRECSFPHGCLIMTGTGIVPEHDFSLRSGDKINISIDGIGSLVNEVE